MPIYMKYDGIDGSVTSAGHEKWIELESCQMGVNRHVATSGRGTNREASAPSISEIVVTKSQDKASIGLFQASIIGDGKTVKIEFMKTEKDKFVAYTTIELENVLVSSYSLSGHGGDGHSAPMESLSLNFTKITVSIPKQDAKGVVGGADKFGWDLATAKKV